MNICPHMTLILIQVTIWKGDIRDYKALLAKKMGLSGVPGKK